MQFYQEFQSTLPRGERPSSVRLCRFNSYFNPRSHEGSDSDIMSLLLFQFIFQSTLPRGERLNYVVIYLYCYYFNPRSHEGSDKEIIQVLTLTCNFNPRSHEGSDYLSDLDADNINISIHAPTRGATYTGGGVHHIRGISIHAPTRGATLPSYQCLKTYHISIHAPTRGATFYYLIIM